MLLCVVCTSVLLTLFLNNILELGLVTYMISWSDKSLTSDQLLNLKAGRNLMTSLVR